MNLSNSFKVYEPKMNGVTFFTGTGMFEPASPVILYARLPHGKSGLSRPCFPQLQVTLKPRNRHSGCLHILELSVGKSLIGKKSNQLVLTQRRTNLTHNNYYTQRL